MMTTTKAMRQPTYAGNMTADGFELCQKYDIRSGRTFERATKECDELERWYPSCDFELRFAWDFSYGRPGTPPGMAPQIQIWTRSKGAR